MSNDLESLLAANRESARRADATGLVRPADGRAPLAIVTCMDARIDPYDVFGLSIGESVILRNPGGQVDDAVLTALALAVRVLGVRTILVMQHTRCAMASPEENLRRAMIDGGAEADAARELELPVLVDQDERLRRDVGRVREAPVLAGAQTAIHGLMFDVDTGLVEQIA